MPLPSFLAPIEPYLPWIIAALTLFVAVRQRQGKATPIADTLLDILSGRPRLPEPKPAEAQALAPREVPPAPLTVPSLRELLREELAALKEPRKDA